MQTSSRLTINAVTNWIYTSTRALTQFILLPFLLLRLGKDSYGLIGLEGVLITFAMLADLGLRAALGRNLTEQGAQKNYPRFNELGSSGTALFAGIGLVIALVFFLAAPQIVQAIKVKSELHDAAVFLVRWHGSTAIFLAFLRPVFSAVYSSANRFDVGNYADIIVTVANALLIYGVLSLTQWGLYGWTGVSICTSVLSLSLAAWMAWRVWPQLRISPRLVRLDTLRPLFSLGWKMFLNTMTGILGVRADALILTAYAGPAAVAVYTPGYSLAIQADQMVLTLRKQLYPLATTYHATGQLEPLRRLLIDGTRYTFLLGIAPMVALFVFAGPLIRTWLGKGLGADTDTAATFLSYWCLIRLAAYSAGPQGAVLLGRNRIRFMVALELGASIVNILLSIYCVGYTRLGIVGVVIPTLLVAVALRPILTIHTARVCELPVKRYLWGAYVRPVIVIMVLGAAGWALRLAVMPERLYSVIACILAMGLLWIPMCWLIGFNREDRVRFGSLFARMLRKIGLAKTPAQGPDVCAPLGADPDAGSVLPAAGAQDKPAFLDITNPDDEIIRSPGV